MPIFVPESIPPVIVDLVFINKVGTTNIVVDIHRVVKEVLEKLVFSCPKCNNVKRTYTEIFKHMTECQGKESGDQPMS